MAKESLHWMKWFPQQWLSSNAFLYMTWEEQGVFRTLLDLAWLNDGLLPNDEGTLKRIARVDDETWTRVRRAVLDKFTATPEGMLCNPVQMDILRKHTDKVRSNRQVYYRRKQAAELAEVTAGTDSAA